MGDGRGVIDRPWSEVVRLNEIGRGLTRHLTADEAVRGRVARFLDLEGLERLDAEVTVAPAAVGWRLSGRLDAVPIQTCGVTLEPFANPTAESFSVDLVLPTDARPEDEPEEELSLDSADPPDVIEDEKVDLASYVVEQLSLALDPFPRKPGAEFQKPDEGADVSPFAKLAALKRPD